MMSTLINDYSMNANPLLPATAGSGCRNKRSFDDLLLLPSLKLNHNTPGRNYVCSSGDESPVLPRIYNDVNVHRKHNTAPASPTHHDLYRNTAVTPHTSPLLADAQLVTPLQKSKMRDCRSFQPRKVSQESLPSLRHLQLLPNPRIQEYAYIYPDTSECTPFWKRNLIRWCRETNYQDYAKILDETTHDRSQLLSLLKNSNSNNDTMPKSIPSVLKPRDTFQNLSNTSKNASTPMTPPMSPNNSINEPQDHSTIEFTPFVSDKLIQTVRNESNKAGLYGHRKTNSFKAMQLKNLLEDRDILSSNSRPNRGRFKVGKVISSSLSSSSTPTQSHSPSRSRRNIFNAARQLVMHLDNEGRRSCSSSPTRSNIIPPATSNHPTVSEQEGLNTRSKSKSPTRPATPPSYSTSKYHKFALDSPQSPVVTTINKNFSQSTKSNLLRRRSSGSNSGVVRKCVSCHSIDSPCWRPSWSGKRHDQLCNSCGLRYKKTHTRCLNDSCRKIPTKGELSIMKSNSTIKQKDADGNIIEGYRCLFCNYITETTELTGKSTPVHVNTNEHDHSV